MWAVHIFSSHAIEVPQYYCKQLHTFFYVDCTEKASTEKHNASIWVEQNTMKKKSSNKQNTHTKNKIEEHTHTWKEKNEENSLNEQRKYFNWFFIPKGIRGYSSTRLTLAHLVWNNVEVKSNMRFSLSADAQMHTDRKRQRERARWNAHVKVTGNTRQFSTMDRNRLYKCI